MMNPSEIMASFEQPDSVSSIAFSGSDTVELRPSKPREHEVELGKPLELVLKLGNIVKKYQVTLVQLDNESVEITDVSEDGRRIDPVARKPFEVGDLVVRVKPLEEEESAEEGDFDTYGLDSFEFVTDQVLKLKGEKVIA